MTMPGSTTDLAIPYASPSDSRAGWPGTNQTMSERIEALLKGVQFSTGAGLIGDGAAATPLELQTPLDWGGGPANGSLTEGPDLRFWGTNPALGNPVYVDAAGNVRSMPEVISDVDSKNAADLAGTYPYGMSIMSIFSASAAPKGWPKGLSCTVVTYRRHGDTDDRANAAQYWHLSTDGGPAETKYRYGGATAWTPWINLVATDTGWIAPSITAGGFTIPGGQVGLQMRQIGEQVYIRGNLAHGTFTGTNVAFGNVPASITPPSYTAGFEVVGSTSKRWVNFLASGAIQLTTGVASSSWFQFNGMYRVD